MNRSFLGGAVVAVVAFALGIVAALFYQEQTGPEPAAFAWNNEFFDDIFDDRFFTHSSDPFEEMQRLRDRIDKYFDRDSARFESTFDEWFRGEFGDYPATAIERVEDDSTIRYEMEIGASELADIDVQVDEKMIEIDATMKSTGKGTQSVSRITQRFPLPENADPASVDVTQEGDKIVIRLSKKETV